MTTKDEIMKILHDRPVLNENLAVMVSFGVLICLALFFVIRAFIPNAPQYTPPVIVVQNARPCLFQDGKWLDVVSFNVDDKKYVCADLETEEGESSLTFSFYKYGKMSMPIKVDEASFKEGEIRFFIDHSLAPGKYAVLISWARPSLAKFDFEIMP